jgi:DNA-binding beta-propeller fold protein YncE
VAAAIFTAVVDWIGPNRPFAGNTVDQIFATSNFLYSLLAAAAGLIFLSWLWRSLTSGTIQRMIYLGVIALFAILTLRTACMASYVNYDDVTEFMVYAHSAAGVKTVVSRVDEIARETQDGQNLVVAYDERSGWLMRWYLRDYPNQIQYGTQLNRSLVDVPVVIVSDHYWTEADRLLSDTHYEFSYMRLYWPVQDYFDLTWNRIWNAIKSPEYRSALWDIWFNRDYSAYAKLTGENLTLSDWPGGEHFRLYVRKDIAVKIWQYGAEAFTPPAIVDPYAGSVRTLKAEAVWGQNGAEPGSFIQPRGIAVAPDGSVYVADTSNNRIQHFDAVGNLIHFWGTLTDPNASSAPNDTFHEPWGVAVGTDGSVYVADTWNYRVQKFSAKGNYLLTLGATGSMPGYQLYGPRAVAVDSRGRVFVTDTGNKRIVIFDSHGEYVDQIGSGGFESGQFDEPVGLAVGPNGRLYVADTWNQRIQVFQEQGGIFFFLSEWPVYGWEGISTDTKPYLAISPDGRVWVTDPGNARILVFDPEGNFLFTFGSYGTDDSSFHLPTGIGIGKDGRIFVTDTDNHRVMVFAAV